MRFIIAFMATVLALASSTVVINLKPWQDHSLAADAPSVSASAISAGAPYAMAVVNVRNLGMSDALSQPGGNGSAAVAVADASDSPAQAPDNAARVAETADERALARAGNQVQPAALQQSVTAPMANTVAQSSAPRGPRNSVADAAVVQPALTISRALVNVRAGPDTAYPVLRQATRGQQFTISARNSDHSWWQVCCIQEQNGWIAAALVQTAGALDAVSEAVNIPPPPAPTSTPEALLVMAAEAPPAAPSTGSCPAQSSRQYTAIPMAGADLAHADYAHGDLNLALRGSAPSSAVTTLVDISGPADPNAPKLNGLFADGRVPTFTSTHQVYDWNWGCGSDGCRGELLTQRASTLVGMATAPGEEIHIPTRQRQIFSGGYMAAVLYAEPTRLTLNYTREGSAGIGYTVHLENVCVDPNLLALYRSSNAEGRRQLPALHNGDVVGVAAGSEIRVSVRDSGTFMEPRSRKDWW
ncbi:MAG: SH3 domain-containing protein [Caldilineaceae bacterium]